MSEIDPIYPVVTPAALIYENNCGASPRVWSTSLIEVVGLGIIVL